MYCLAAFREAEFDPITKLLLIWYHFSMQYCSRKKKWKKNKVSQQEVSRAGLHFLLDWLTTDTTTRLPIPHASDDKKKAKIGSLTCEIPPAQECSKRWRSIWCKQWCSSAIAVWLQWMVLRLWFLWSSEPDEWRRKQIWTHNERLRIVKIGRNIYSFFCQHSCQPKGNDDQISPHNCHIWSNERLLAAERSCTWNWKDFYVKS